MSGYTIISHTTEQTFTVDELTERWADLPSRDLLADIFALFGCQAAIGTSFQKTGLVTLDLASQVAENYRVFTIDTGRLFPETHEYMWQIAERYHLDLEIYRCDEEELQKILTQSPFREFLFLENERLRKLCCYTRRILPRNRALQTLDIWIAGLRKDQSQFRSIFPKVDLITAGEKTVLKVLPMFDWTEADLNTYIRQHSLSVHPLYAQGYTTIGCQLPCSTPSIKGEDARAGRWRWEKASVRECALHLPEYQGGTGI